MREERDKLDRDLLKADQRAEREAWFKNGAKLFKATRHAVYDEVRAEFRPEWRSLYKEHAAARKEAEAASKSGISRAHHFARNGQWAEARAAYKDRHHIVNAVNTAFTARLKDLKERQKTTLKDRQDAAITALREARDPAYKLLLARQYAERAALRAEQAQAGHQSERPTISAQDYLDQVRAASAANENKDPAATPPQAANANAGPTPPEADAKRANGALETETARQGQARASSVAGMESRSHHSADPDDPRAHPFKLADPGALSRSGHTLDAFASVLASTPRNNHSDVALVGLALHQEFKGSDAAKDLYSQWASGNSAWANGETEMVWAGIKSDAPNITGLPMVIAIARASGASTDLLTPIMEPKEEKAPREHQAEPHDVTSEPEAAEPFKQAPDLAAGAIGALAGYIADQIGEALAPTQPERALVVTGTGEALIVEIKSSAVLAKLPTKGGLFFWSRDGKRVANYEGIWDIQAAKLIVAFDNADCGTPRDWSEVSHRLAFIHGMNSVVFCLMDAQSGKLVRFVDHSAPERHTREIGAALFVADGRRVVTVADDDSARLWDAATGKHIALLGRARREMAVNLETAGRGFIPFAISADGQLIVTGHSDGAVRVWEAKGGGLVAELKDLGGHVSEVAIDSSGRFVAAGSADNRLYLWPLDVDLSRTKAKAAEKTVRCLGSEERVDVGLEPSLPDWCYEFRKWPAPPVRAGFEMESTPGSMDAVLGKSRVGEGVRVVRVYRNLPADRAGIRVGDAIIEINGQPMTEAKLVQARIAELPIGKVAKFKVDRNGEAIELDLIPRQ